VGDAACGCVYTLIMPAPGNMSVVTVYFNHPDVADVTWDPTLEAVHVEWQGWASSTERAACLEAGLSALIEHHASRWLVDGRVMRAVKQADQDWINQSWFPRVFAAGLRKMAVVTPISSLAKMNIDDILARVAGTQLEVAQFATLGEARAWLTTP
jgi:SpoIIAA-like